MALPEASPSLCHEMSLEQGQIHTSVYRVHAWVAPAVASIFSYALLSLSSIPAAFSWTASSNRCLVAPLTIVSLTERSNGIGVGHLTGRAAIKGSVLCSSNLRSPPPHGGGQNRCEG